MSGYARPRTLAEALRLRAAEPTRTVLAGGTDLMVAQRPALEERGVIDLFGLSELEGIAARGEALVIGAGTTLAAIETDPAVLHHAPLLAAVAREFAALQIRHRATLAGNLVTCSPVGDSFPALLALDGAIEVASVHGRRLLPAVEFVTGYRATALAPDELVLAVHLPRAGDPRRWYWRKVASRRAQGITKVSLAATASLDAKGCIRAPRLAMGAVADRPLRLGTIEALLAGAVPDPDLARTAATATRQAITPITDVRSTAGYRSTVAGNLVAAFVRSLER